MRSLHSERYTAYLVDGEYTFSTDDGRIYSVTFEEQAFFDNDDFPFADRTYELFLTLQKTPPAYSTDDRIGVTLAAIVRNFIERDPSRLVCFTCDTADGRHLARFKRFNSWFSENNNGQYLKLEESIPYPAIDRLFLVSLIIRNDNPHAAETLISFVQLTTNMRSQK